MASSIFIEIEILEGFLFYILFYAYYFGLEKDFVDVNSSAFQSFEYDVVWNESQNVIERLRIVVMSELY